MVVKRMTPSIDPLRYGFGNFGRDLFQNGIELVLVFRHHSAIIGKDVGDNARRTRKFMMTGELIILEFLHPPHRIEVSDAAPLDHEIGSTCRAEDAGHFIHLDFCRHVEGTKAFSLVSMGIWGSIWKPTRAIIPAIRRTGRGFFAIFTEISVRNWPYDQELFFFHLFY